MTTDTPCPVARDANCQQSCKSMFEVAKAEGGRGLQGESNPDCRGKAPGLLTHRGTARAKFGGGLRGPQELRVQSPWKAGVVSLSRIRFPGHHSVTTAK